MNDQLVLEGIPEPRIEPPRDVIPSVFYDQKELLYAIQQLYGPIQADVTYSTGQFWNGMSVKPSIKADLTPQSGDVVAADFTKLPFASRSISSMIIDPPFLVDRGKEESYAEDSLQMTKRFTAYNDLGHLMSSYTAAFYEAYRVLQTGGYLAFKCQDIVSRQKQVVTHCFVWQMALNAGFTVEDMFILVANARIMGAWKQQKHSRHFHSYVWVFRKPKGIYGIQTGTD